MFLFAVKDVKVQADYVKRLLKKLIFEVESSGGIVLDELYEQCASYMISLKVWLTVVRQLICIAQAYAILSCEFCPLW